MFIWIGCRLPEAFEQEIRRYCRERNRQIGLDETAFEMPQHISLKISFETDRPVEVVEELARFAGKQTPFIVRILNVEQEGGILWLPVEENERLTGLHVALDRCLESRFGVPQHEFDKCFKFHSTLFMDADLGKVAQMRRLLEGYPFARELTVDTFLVGASETGKPGTCRIVRQIRV